MSGDDRALTELYPEVMSAGGLGYALAAEARGQGVVLKLDERTVSPMAFVGSDNVHVKVHMTGRVDRFWLEGWRLGVDLISGVTPSLAEVVSVCARWKDGFTLQQMTQRFPFLHYEAMAEAHEKGPAEAVEQKWRTMLDSESSRHPSTMTVLKEAHSRPTLRRLFPFTSVMDVHFSRCTGYPFTHDAPWVEPLAEGEFRVAIMQPWHGDTARVVELAVVKTAAEAVDVVLANLPADCGPAVAGTAEDL
jgi:hypothetical protein